MGADEPRTAEEARRLARYCWAIMGAACLAGLALAIVIATAYSLGPTLVR